jgi:hypothetical protein
MTRHANHMEFRAPIATLSISGYPSVLAAARMSSSLSTGRKLASGTCTRRTDKDTQTDIQTERQTDRQTDRHKRVCGNCEYSYRLQPRGRVRALAYVVLLHVDFLEVLVLDRADDAGRGLHAYATILFQRLVKCMSVTREPKTRREGNASTRKQNTETRRDARGANCLECVGVDVLDLGGNDVAAAGELLHLCLCDAQANVSSLKKITRSKAGSTLTACGSSKWPFIQGPACPAGESPPLGSSAVM